MPNVFPFLFYVSFSFVIFPLIESSRWWVTRIPLQDVMYDAQTEILMRYFPFDLSFVMIGATHGFSCVYILFLVFLSILFFWNNLHIIFFFIFLVFLLNVNFREIFLNHIFIYFKLIRFHLLAPFYVNVMWHICALGNLFYLFVFDFFIPCRQEFWHSMHHIS